MKQIALFGRPISTNLLPEIKEVLSILEQKQIKITIWDKLYAFLKKHYHFKEEVLVFRGYEDMPHCDFAVSLGGDGTLLELITIIRDKNIPIVGINAGRLGFLASIPIEDSVQSIMDVLEGNYTLDERILIRFDSEQNVFNTVNFGLNEFTILKRDTSSMIVIHTYLDDVFLNSYWADGLIVSTPTGSTGYSLSCGGPLVMPQTQNFIVAPVNPHNLNVRPMIVPASSKLSFKVEGRSKKVLVSLDSRSRPVSSTIDMNIRKEDFKINLITTPGLNYFNTLRNKLNWGMDIRNIHE
jgi:NAD+ kinase